MPKCRHIHQTSSGSNSIFYRIMCSNPECEEITYQLNVAQVDRTMLARHVRRLEERMVYPEKDTVHRVVELRDFILANRDHTTSEKNRT